MNEILHKKVSPPFEGGVVGTIDYLIYTVFYFPTGVVDLLNPRERIGFAELSAKWRIGSPLLAQSASIKNLP
jgi:hypothetical protein